VPLRLAGVVATVVALLLCASCTTGGTPLAHPTATTPSTQPPSPAPSPRPPSPRPSAPTPTPPAPLAPLAFDDVAFGTAESGWAVGGRSLNDTVLLASHTSDGGVTWSAPVTVTTLAAASESQGVAVRFADSQHGWVSGPGLFATADGGQSWQPAPVTGTVEPVAPAGGTAWALDYPCGNDQACAPTLIESPVATERWAPAGSQPTLPAAPATLLRVSAGSAFIFVAASLGAVQAPWFETQDGGATWRALTNPCGQSDSADVPASLDGRTIWVACGVEPSAGTELKQVFVSSDGGSTWQLRAQTADLSGPAVGTLTQGGYVSDLQMASNTLGFMALSRGGILRSADRGRTWTQVDLPGATFGDLFPSLWVLDASHAWVETGSGGNPAGWPGLLRSTDGGVTWLQVSTSQ
jgi:photosystem II stability/assembly factor-like uncharacterized protein